MPGRTMKPMRITYITLGKKKEPNMAQITGKLIIRQVNETLTDFKARCEAMQHMMMEE